MKSSNATTNFGLHLTIDGYNGDATKLNSMEHVFKVLDDLPSFLAMTKLITPYVVAAPGNDKKDPGGYSGFVMIQESHISVHTFPKRRFVSIDVYSCKNFDTGKTKEYLTKAFGLGECETNIIVRGTRYPTENASRRGNGEKFTHPRGSLQLQRRG
ncbi:MAG: S-adenosylmethionine decarboxylase [Candidatus Sungbacteria bacterium]|uniref:S-adenosylmethionine decarboxylase n=1 Tax=Candidatus Sungiibacteriota bacterium TaxID=2750080 RepID=A0A9D6QVB2_9BACT|nr:S-adenosylmethionine decarboxylase [Candidatus Sungbacteria bacterium]